MGVLIRLELPAVSSMTAWHHGTWQKSAPIPYPPAFHELPPPSFNLNGEESSNSILPTLRSLISMKGSVRSHTQCQCNANLSILLSAKHP